MKVFHLLVGLCVLLSASTVTSGLDREAEEDEIGYLPKDSALLDVNPPAFVWLPVGGHSTYLLQYSSDKLFSQSATTTERVSGRQVFVPSEILNPGPWFWRFGVESNNSVQWSQVREFTIEEDAIHLPYPDIKDVIERIPTNRPRLYYTPERVKKIRESGNPNFDRRRDSLARRAEAIVRRQIPLFPEPIGFQPLDKDKEFLQAIQDFRSHAADLEILALAYLYSGEERYADEAKRHLLHILSWDIEGSSRSGGLAMDIAERAYRVFDWIHHVLNPEEQKFAQEVLAQRLAAMHAIHRSFPMETRPFSSHPGRMLGFVVEGAIALAHDVPQSEVWLDDTLKVLWSVYPAWGGSDGGWHEGVLYWRAYLRRILHVVLLLDQIGVPLKERPFFRNTGYFGFYNAFPGQATIGFGDSAERSPGSGEGSVLLMLSKLYDNSHFKWYADKLDGQLPFPSAVLLEGKSVEAEEPLDLPLSRVFPSVGWVAMHSDFANIDKNVTLLFKSSPTGAISHNYANQNAFLLEAFGEALAIQSGYRSNFHGSPHHTGWKWNTKAHNSLLVDGEGQITRGRDSSGLIVHHEEKGNYAYTIGDAVEAYGGRLNRFDRHVFFKRPDYFIIVDDLESASSESTYQWLLHALDEMEINATDNIVIVKQGAARLRVEFLSPDLLDLKQVTGFDPAPKRNNPSQYPDQFHLTASTVEPVREQKIITLMSVFHEDFIPDEIDAEIISGGNPLLLSVNNDLILMNLSSGNVDGNIRSTGNRVEFYQLGSYLRQDFRDQEWQEDWFVETEGAEVAHTPNGLKIHTPESLREKRLGTTIWLKEDLPENVWIQAHAEVLDTESFNAANLNFILHARELDGSSYRGGRSGDYPEYHSIPNYIFTFTGGDRQGWSRLRLNPGFELLSEKDIRSERGETYLISLLIAEGRIRCWINEELVHDVEIEKPLEGGAFGFRTWSSNVILNHVSIKKVLR